MTATCREACCSAQPRLTVSELFERGYRRNRAAPLPIEGAPCIDAEDNSARFSLDALDGKIISVGFHATTCTTLIAYCEYIAEVLPSFRLEIAKELTAAQLVASVSGVPSLKQNRAVLAIAAFRASLAAALHPSQKKRFAMKVAYIFATQRHNVSYVLAKMILPQLEENRHGVDVVGMFFFEDNNFVLVDGNPIGARLLKVAQEKNILLMGCDQCCYEREIADRLFKGVPIGCFPDLYKALSGNPPDQVITL
jgi:hypothetical protein